MKILYLTFKSKFGICLIASTDKGICNILFANSAKEALLDLKSRWPNSKITRKSLPEHSTVQKLILNHKTNNISKIKLDLHGTDFQKKVWKALLDISTGKTSTYGAIAKKLGDKNLSRAVGTAIGSNPIGYIIPCHRVLKSDGKMSGYRWGIERKVAMLDLEAKRA